MTEKEFYKKVENIFGKEYVFKCRGSHSCDGFHYLKLDENVVGHAVYILFKVYKMKFNWNGIYYITKKLKNF